MTPRESLRSIVEVSEIFISAGRLLVADAVKYGAEKLEELDTRLCNAINGVDDE